MSSPWVHLELTKGPSPVVARGTPKSVAWAVFGRQKARGNPKALVGPRSGHKRRGETQRRWLGHVRDTKGASRVQTMAAADVASDLSDGDRIAS